MTLEASLRRPELAEGMRLGAWPPLRLRAALLRLRSAQEMRLSAQGAQGLLMQYGGLMAMTTLLRGCSELVEGMQLRSG